MVHTQLSRSLIMLALLQHYDVTAVEAKQRAWKQIVRYFWLVYVFDHVKT
jgi:hypothetical protein